jgi:hypothetical protein
MAEYSPFLSMCLRMVKPSTDGRRTSIHVRAPRGEGIGEEVLPGAHVSLPTFNGRVMISPNLADEPVEGVLFQMLATISAALLRLLRNILGSGDNRGSRASSSQVRPAIDPLLCNRALRGLAFRRLATMRSTVTESSGCQQS